MVVKKLLKSKLFYFLLFCLLIVCAVQGYRNYISEYKDNCLNEVISLVQETDLEYIQVYVDSLVVGDNDLYVMVDEEFVADITEILRSATLLKPYRTGGILDELINSGFWDSYRHLDSIELISISTHKIGIRYEITFRIFDEGAYLKINNPFEYYKLSKESCDQLLNLIESHYVEASYTVTGDAVQINPAIDLLMSGTSILELREDTVLLYNKESFEIFDGLTGESIYHESFPHEIVRVESTSYEGCDFCIFAADGLVYYRTIEEPGDGFVYNPNVRRYTTMFRHYDTKPEYGLMVWADDHGGIMLQRAGEAPTRILEPEIRHIPSAGDPDETTEFVIGQKYPRILNNGKTVVTMFNLGIVVYDIETGNSSFYDCNTTGISYTVIDDSTIAGRIDGTYSHLDLETLEAVPVTERYSLYKDTVFENGTHSTVVYSSATNEMLVHIDDHLFRPTALVCAGKQYGLITIKNSFYLVHNRAGE